MRPLAVPCLRTERAPLPATSRGRPASARASLPRQLAPQTLRCARAARRATRALPPAEGVRAHRAAPAPPLHRTFPAPRDATRSRQATGSDCRTNRGNERWSGLRRRAPAAPAWRPAARARHERLRRHSKRARVPRARCCRCARHSSPPRHAPPTGADPRVARAFAPAARRERQPPR